MLTKKGRVANKYHDIRKVLGYGPSLGIQREYQKSAEPPQQSPVKGPAFQTVKRHHNVATPRRPEKPEVLGINVVRNGFPKKLPELFYH